MSTGPSKPRVVVVGNAAKPMVGEAISRCLPLLRRHAHIVAVDLKLDIDLSATRADRVIIFGGDGAILSTARRMGRRQIPVIGVNLGKFGFMAEFSVDEVRQSLAALLSGDCPVSQRMMLDCRIERDGRRILASLALNDVVVSRGALSRMISITLLLDGEQANCYSGDGLIVATPVGSTAHSLAAGGPIVEPHMEALILSPICPHTLSNRPLVIPGDRRIELVVSAAPVAVAVTVDGQVNLPLQAGDRILIRKARSRFRLIETRTRTYYQTLREKLDWRGEPHYVARQNS